MMFCFVVVFHLKLLTITRISNKCSDDLCFFFLFFFSFLGLQENKVFDLITAHTPISSQSSTFVG